VVRPKAGFWSCPDRTVMPVPPEFGAPDLHFSWISALHAQVDLNAWSVHFRFTDKNCFPIRVGQG
jgi:hypothetical protein